MNSEQNQQTNPSTVINSLYNDISNPSLASKVEFQNFYASDCVQVFAGSNIISGSLNKIKIIMKEFCESKKYFVDEKVNDIY